MVYATFLNDQALHQRRRDVGTHSLRELALNQRLHVRAGKAAGEAEAGKVGTPVGLGEVNSALQNEAAVQRTLICRNCGVELVQAPHSHCLELAIAGTVNAVILVRVVGQIEVVDLTRVLLLHLDLITDQAEI